MASKLMIVVFVFDAIAFALAVAAEQMRSTARVIPDYDSNYNFCVYNSNISTWFGVGAFLFLMASQVLIMVACCCVKSLKPEASRACTVLLFITCWVFFIVTEVCLLAGSVMNTHHTKYRTIFGSDPPFCKTVRKGVFAAGAAFIFLNFIVSKLHYFCLFESQESFVPYDGEAGVALITSK